jgi:uncharacterized RDD family membrane protein YckC
MSEIVPGWYKDPADPSTQRYWDGEGWLGKPLPADATPPDGPPPAEEPAPPPGAVPPAIAAAGATPGTHPEHPHGPPPPGWGPPPPSGPGAPPQSWGPPPPAGTGGPPQGWGPPPPAGTGAPPQGWGPPPPAGTGAPPQVWGAPPQGWGAPPPSDPGAPPQGWGPPPGVPGHPGLKGAYPYQTQVRPHGFALAGLGPRLMARLLDIGIVLLLNIAVNGWFAYQWVQESLPIMRAAMENPLGTPPEASERSQYLMLTMLLIATALWLAYEVPAIGDTGQTLGKRIMHIKVVRVEKLEPIGYGRAFRRWARLGMWTPLWWCAGIGLLFQLIDSASVLFDKTMRQALHDKTANTVVVEAPPVRQAASAGTGAGPGGADERPDTDKRGGSTADNGVPDDGPDPTGGAR